MSNKEKRTHARYELAFPDEPVFNPLFAPDILGLEKAMEMALERDSPLTGEELDALGIEVETVPGAIY
jgi:hypothetical protein